MEENTVGFFLKSFIKEQGLTLEEFAKIMGTSFGLIGHYTTGRRTPTYDFLDNLFTNFRFTDMEKLELIYMLDMEKSKDSVKEIRERQYVLLKTYLKEII